MDDEECIVHLLKRKEVGGIRIQEEILNCHTIVERDDKVLSKLVTYVELEVESL